MADVIFDRFLSGQIGGEINLTGDPIYVRLITGGGWFPDATSGNTTGDIPAGVEVVGTNYTGGGQQLAGLSLTTVGAAGSRTGVFDASDVTWKSSTITNASGAVVWASGTYHDGDSGPLIAYIDFTENKSSSAGDFTIQWDAGGILHFRQGS